MMLILISWGQCATNCPAIPNEFSISDRNFTIIAKKTLKYTKVVSISEGEMGLYSGEKEMLLLFVYHKKRIDRVSLGSKIRDIFISRSIDSDSVERTRLEEYKSIIMEMLSGLSDMERCDKVMWSIVSGQTYPACDINFDPRYSSESNEGSQTPSSQVPEGLKRYKSPMMIQYAQKVPSARDEYKMRVVECGECRMCSTLAKSSVEKYFE